MKIGLSFDDSSTFPTEPYYEYLGLERPGDPTEEETEPRSDTDVTSAPSPDTSVPDTDETPTDLWITVAVIAAVVIAASVTIAIAVRKKRT